MNSTNSKKSTNSFDQEKFKLLYVETATSFRHFLTWRKAIFASYFAIIYALAKALIWSIQNVDNGIPSISAGILIIGVIISIAFLLLEIRNRELHYHAAETCVAIERSVNAEDLGLYSLYENKKLKTNSITHTRVIHTVYIISAFIMLVLAILLIIGVIDFKVLKEAIPPIIIS